MSELPKVGVLNLEPVILSNVVGLPKGAKVTLTLEGDIKHPQIVADFQSGSKFFRRGIFHDGTVSQIGINGIGLDKLSEASATTINPVQIEAYHELLTRVRSAQAAMTAIRVTASALVFEGDGSSKVPSGRLFRVANPATEVEDIVYIPLNVISHNGQPAHEYNLGLASYLKQDRDPALLLKMPITFRELSPQLSDRGVQHYATDAFRQCVATLNVPSGAGTSMPRLGSPAFESLVAA